MDFQMPPIRCHEDLKNIKNVFLTSLLNKPLLTSFLCREILKEMSMHDLHDSKVWATRKQGAQRWLPPNWRHATPTSSSTSTASSLSLQQEKRDIFFQKKRGRRKVRIGGDDDDDVLHDGLKGTGFLKNKISITQVIQEYFHSKSKSPSLQPNRCVSSDISKNGDKKEMVYVVTLLCF